MAPVHAAEHRPGAGVADDVGRGGGGLRPRRADRRGVPGRRGAAGAGARGPRPGRRQHPGVPRHHEGAEYRVRRGRALHRRLRAGRAVPHDLRRARRRRPDALPAARPRRVRHAALPGPGASWCRPAGTATATAWSRRSPRSGPASSGSSARCDAVAEEGRARPIPGVETPTFDRWAFRPLSELFDEGELSQRCRAVLDHWSGLYAGGPRQTAVAMHAVDHRPLHAGRLLPRGRRPDDPGPADPGDRGPRRRGPHPDPGAADRRWRAGGPPAWCWRTAPTIAADLVISNADHARTVFGLVGEEHWDPATVRWTREARDDPGPGVRVPGGRRRPHRRAEHQLLRVPRLRDRRPLRGARRRRAGGPGRVRLRRHGVAQGPRQRRTCARRADQPADHDAGARGAWSGGASRTSPAEGGPYRRGERYRERKQQLTEALLDAAERVLADQLGGERLRDHIVHVETATPLSQERYTRSTGGTSYGYVHSPEQSGDQPAPAPHRDRRAVAGRAPTPRRATASPGRWSAACTAPGRSWTGRCWWR